MRRRMRDADRRTRAVVKKTALVSALVFVVAGISCSAALGAVRLEKRLHVGGFVEGASVLGSRYAYVGTSSSDEMDVIGVPAMSLSARWNLPTLGDAIDYGMDLVSISSDDRWLLVVNKVRGDIVVIDVTGVVPARSVHLVSPFANAVATSPDDHLLYVAGASGVDVYELATGGHMTSFGAPASSVAVGRDGRVWVLGIANHRAEIRTYGPMGQAPRTIAAWSGQSLAGQNGMIALSPDGRRVYGLFDGLRAFDTASGARRGDVRLPVTPTYNGVSIAPNGRQAMLWARNFSGVGEVPTGNPRYVRVHFGFIAGGVVPIDLTHMRAISAPSLRGLNTPRQVAYLSNSRYAVVSQIHEVDLIATGTSGRDNAVYPPVNLTSPSGGSPSTGAGGTGAGGGGGGTGGGGKACSAWNISGAWTWQPGPADGGPAKEGPASLVQSGSAVTGTIESGTLTWSLNGTLNGANLNLAMTASGQVPIHWAGSVTGEGAELHQGAGTEVVAEGNFVKGHAACTG